MNLIHVDQQVSMSKTTTIGLHGHEVLGLLYRYGCLTVAQLHRLTGLSESGIKRQLGYLVDAGFVAKARDVAGWQRTSMGRPRTAYYLTSPLGAKTAAFAIGIENDYLALRHYRRVRLPGTVSHRLLANEYLLSIREAVGNLVADEEIFSESCPQFPIFGTGIPKSDRSDSPYRFTRIVPDSRFQICNTRYFLEVETKFYGHPDLVGKGSDYGGYYRRLLSPNSGEKKFHNPSARLEPVVILTPETETADRLQKYLQERLPKSEEWASAREAIRVASTPDEEGAKPKGEPGMLILVASFEEVSEDPLGRHYRPLRPYPKSLSSPSPQGEPGGRVSLADAAAISQKIIVPAKPPKPETLDTLGDDSKKDKESAA